MRGDRDVRLLHRWAPRGEPRARRREHLTLENAILRRRSASAFSEPTWARSVRRPIGTSTKSAILVERFFDKIKHFHRITTRYEKTALSFAAMLFLVRRHDLAPLNVNRT
jgi:transposase